MIHRFDHLVIGVRDLAAATALYRDTLGFDVYPGGRHTGRGTHNAIVRFGLDYLELIAVEDAAEARQAGRGDLVEYLRERPGGSVAYALATDDIEAEARRFEARGLEAVGPFAMQRLRPDGQRLSWRLLVPHGTQYRRAWPFLIQWDQPDAERLALDPPGAHRNGAVGVVGLAVAVPDLEAGRALYRDQLGLAVLDEDALPELAAHRVRFAVGSLRLDLLAPTGPGPIQDELQRMGPGPYQVTLATRSGSEARAFFQRSGVRLDPAPGVEGGWQIDPDAALGTRLVIQVA